MPSCSKCNYYNPFAEHPHVACWFKPYTQPRHDGFGNELVYSGDVDSCLTKNANFQCTDFVQKKPLFQRIKNIFSIDPVLFAYVWYGIVFIVIWNIMAFIFGFIIE